MAFNERGILQSLDFTSLPDVGNPDIFYYLLTEKYFVSWNQTTGLWENAIPVVSQPFKINTTITHTGTLLETIIYSYRIPGGTFQSNDDFEIYIRVFANSNANTKEFRQYFNTPALPSDPPSLIGATQFALLTTTSSPGAQGWHRNVVFKNSTNSQEVIAAASTYQTDYVVNSSTLSALGIDFSVDVDFIISAKTPISTSDIAGIRSLRTSIYR